MTHEMYKQVLEAGDFVRMVNTRIASSRHQICTLVVNKKSLSGYDDKRYVLPNKVSTLPFGHFSLREEMFERAIAEDPEWGLSEMESDIEEINSQIANRSSSFLPTDDDSSWASPDPGLAPRDYTESDLEDVLDLENLSENDFESEDEKIMNPFIDYEAEESYDDVPVYEISDPEFENSTLESHLQQNSIAQGKPEKRANNETYKTPLNSKAINPISEERIFDPSVMTPYESEPQSLDHPDDVTELSPEQPETTVEESQRKFTGNCILNIDPSNEPANQKKPKRRIVRRKLFPESDDENKENIPPPAPQKRRRRRAVIYDSSDDNE